MTRGWCDSLAETVEGLLDLADEDAALCRSIAHDTRDRGSGDQSCGS
jgi:hypothetical protein